VLPANFIEGRQSVKEITCDLIQVARAGESRTGRDGRCDPHGQVVWGVSRTGRWWEVWEWWEKYSFYLPQSHRGLTAGYVNTNFHEIESAKNSLLYIISRIFTWR